MTELTRRHVLFGGLSLFALTACSSQTVLADPAEPLPPVEERIEALAAQIARLEEQGKTVVVVLDGRQVLGLLAIRDEPRADAKEAVARLKGLGVRSLMLTGDNARTGSRPRRDLPSSAGRAAHGRALALQR